jgi:hypothetical protein
MSLPNRTPDAVSTGGRLPTFLIIGAPKAGTTSLASYLAAHPDVFVAEEKEVHFFDRQFDRGVDWYRSRFADAGAARAIGDASPTYMYLDHALDHITETVPDARLVAVLRNPVDRAYSHFWWERALTERRSFAEAVRQEISEGEATPRRRRYLQGGFYLGRLEEVVRRFPREQLLVVVLEDIRNDLDRVYAEVCRHIGVDDTYRPEHLGVVENPAYALRWPWLRFAMRRSRAWKRLPGDLAARIDRLNRKDLHYNPMDPSLRAELVEHYADANAGLARWLGRDLPGWDR